MPRIQVYFIGVAFQSTPSFFFESRIRPTHPGQLYLLLADFCLLIPPADAILLESWRVNLPR